MLKCIISCFKEYNMFMVQSGGRSSNSKRKASYIEKSFGIISAHPYISAFIVCIAAGLMFFGSIDNMAAYTPAVLGLLSCCASALMINHICNKHKISFYISLALTLAATFLCLGAAWWFRNTHHKLVMLFCFGCLFILGMYFTFFTSKMRRLFNSLLIMGISFMVKLIYVLGTSMYTRQHDVGDLGGRDDIFSGHLGYITYLFHNHHLYDGDYREYMQYCHPPLHHTICAVWMKLLNVLFHIDIQKGAESAQFLSLFYSMAILITAYKIFRYFGLDGKALYIPLLITAFHPCFIFLSALLNNDPLAWALVMGAVYCTLKWYREPDLKNIMKIALCVGLGMMAKLSAALAAPSIAAVFIIVFFRSFRTSWKKLLGQFIAFGAVCFPLGMWFPLRGYIRWNIPLTYVQELPEMPQSIKGISFMKRITDFSPVQLERVFENWLWYDDTGAARSFNEHNPLIAILKNSVFSEHINENDFRDYSFMLNVCTALFWLAAALAAAAFVLMIVYIFRKCAADRVQKLFLVSFHLILIANLYNLSKNYPMVCSMNFRYLMPTVITGALFLGFAQVSLNKSGKSSAKAVSLSLFVLTAAFAVMSSLVYFISAITT